MSRLLLVRPEGDGAAMELSRWAESLANAFEGSIHERHDLKGKDVSRGAVEAELANSRALLFFGHSRRSGLIAEDTDVLDNRNIDRAIGKIVIAIACSSAKDLGAKAISDGL